MECSLFFCDEAMVYGVGVEVNNNIEGTTVYDQELGAAEIKIVFVWPLYEGSLCILGTDRDISVHLKHKICVKVKL